MKASFLKTSFILLSLILVLGFVLIGCKKETPPPQELTAKEKEFLSAPDATICKLEKTKISKLDLPKNNMASFFRYMEQQNRHYVKQAQITLANRPFKIIVGHYPKREREFYIYDIEKGFCPYWPGYSSLHSYHKIDDKFFEFMLIENDTKIAARPYKGPLGIIKIGKGSRELEKVEFNGSLKNEDYVAVPVGAIKERWPDAVTECAIPVGDYTPDDMYVTYDNLYMRISDNSTNAQGHSNRKDIVYGMQVREDKPYVLDFSNEPMVIFDQPSMSKTAFSRGQEIKFAAVLIDSKLDIMIRGLYDTSVKVDKEYKDRDGKVVHTTTLNKSLDPNVVISRADGEVLAEGVMPFG